MQIAVTGVMEGPLDRHRLEEHILCLGGKVAASVSGQTTYLVSGRLLEGEPRRPALSLPFPTLSERGSY